MTDAKPPVVVAQAEQPRAWHWSIWATIIAPLLVMGILIWQLAKLDPAHYCGVAFGMVKLAGAGGIEALKAGFACLSDLANIYRMNTLALIVVLAVCIVAIVVTTVKARVSLEGFGFKGGVGSDDALPVRVEQPADKPVPVSQESRP